MQILIDADACPVVDIAIVAGLRYRVKCALFCDTSHDIRRSGAITVVVDKAAEHTPVALSRCAAKDDIVITQDYDLAALCLGRGAKVLHHDGWEYTSENIEELLMQRQQEMEARAKRVRTRREKPRTADQDRAFASALDSLLRKILQG